ncbi:MAG TPA: metallophosphoesterase [Vicinamibacterales bacterium]|nr:metallophosphoesterase [Vicinamibacterales bacterium]
MTRRLIAWAAAAVLAAAAAPHPTLRAAAPDCEFTGVERIVAIGDVHGAYDRFVAILKTTGLVDDKLRWSGGKAHLVQLGDVVDRGPDSRKALDFIQRLTRDAQGAGGRVHALMGNHEAMRLIGDYRYVAPGEYAAFATPDSENLRNKYLETRPAADRETLLQKTPLGFLEMIGMFAPDGDYGSRLKNLNAVVRVNDVLFMHGGLSPSVAAQSCASINDTVRRAVSTTANLQKTRSAPQEALATSANGPLWYRGLAEEPDTFAPDVARIIDAQHARAIVVAHTVQTSGRIQARFSDKVFLIDTGMQSAYVSTGRASALEIRGDVFTAIYEDGQQVLRRDAGGSRP